MGAPITSAQDFEEEATDELESGQTLMQGQYTIEKFIQAGGFGITYLARNSLNGKVIIKECFPGSFCRRSARSVRARSSAHAKGFSSIVSKFVEEAHSLAKVKHPNIVGVHQVFEENDTAYMVLDFVDGADLLDVIDGKVARPTPEQIEVMLSKMLGAIGAIHGLGMLHRDISPDNIMLQSDMEPILIDFGAAREDAPPESRKVSEMRVVKDGYSPQEFYVAGAIQGPSSDLYALGATFYHLITGDLPIDSQRRLAAVATGEGDLYVPLAGRMENYSEAFLQGIDTAMAVLPKNRFETAGHWLEFMSGTGATGGAAASVTSTQGAAQVSQLGSGNASKTKTRLLGGIALLLPVIGAVYALQGGDTASAPDAATSTLTIAEPTTTAAAAPPSPAAGPGSFEGAAPAADLSAILLPQPEDISPEAVEDIRPDASETASTGGADVTADFERPGAVDPQDLELASTFNQTPADAGDPALADITPPQDALDTTPEPLIEIFDLPEVASAWSVDLTDVLPDAADEVFEVNGVPLETTAQIDTVLHTTMPAPRGGQLELSVLAGASENDATVQSVTAPVIHKTSFADGTTFEARMVDGAWITVVTDAPAGSEFEVGDVVVGDLGSEIRFEDRASLPNSLVQANAQNLTRLTLAIRRGVDLSAISILVPR